MDGVLRFVGATVPQLVRNDDTVSELYPWLYLIPPAVPVVYISTERCAPKCIYDLPEIWEAVDAYECLGGGGVIVGGKLINEVVPTTGGE